MTVAITDMRAHHLRREEVAHAALDGVALKGVIETRQFYRLLDTLVARFPHIEFESCSSGGGRIDYELLSEAQKRWLRLRTS
jgi:alpha-galactosidase